MAALTITAASVAVVTGTPKPGVAGETITQGMAVYKAANGRWYKAQCDGSLIESGYGTEVGVSLNSVAVLQLMDVLTDGTYTVGATLTVGLIYALSATAGGIEVATAIVSPQYMTVIGVPISTTVLRLRPIAGGQTIA